jgi:hypothetical protein
MDRNAAKRIKLRPPEVITFVRQMFTRLRQEMRSAFDYCLPQWEAMA